MLEENAGQFLIGRISARLLRRADAEKDTKKIYCGGDGGVYDSFFYGAL